MFKLKTEPLGNANGCYSSVHHCKNKNKKKVNKNITLGIYLVNVIDFTTSLYTVGFEYNFSFLVLIPQKSLIQRSVIQLAL